MEIYVDSYEAFVDFEQTPFPWEQFSKIKIDAESVNNKFWERTLGLPNISSRMTFIDEFCEKFDNVSIDPIYFNAKQIFE
jgi:hypothetical protein